MALYRQQKDEEGIASALTDLGMIALLGQRDDIPIAAVMEELQDLKPRLENRTTLAYLLILEGLITASQGNLELSVVLHKQSLEVSREIRDMHAVVNCLLHLGFLALVRGDYEGALPPLREGLRLSWDLAYTSAIQLYLFAQAGVAVGKEQSVRAARLWGAVEGMEDDYGVRVTPITQSFTDYEGRLATARSQLDEEAWSEAWAQGKTMSTEQAVEYALGGQETSVSHESCVAPPDPLTRRQREVAVLIGEGFTNRRIAEELHLSEHTIITHVRDIRKKLGVHSRARIAAWITEEQHR